MRPAYWELRGPGRARANPIVCGRKFCTVCGRWRLLCDFTHEGDKPRGACVTCRRVAARTAARNIPRHRLDPAPLLALLDRVPIGELGALARRAGVSERAIRRYRTGESRHIDLDLADRLALALGSHLSLIYDDTPADPLPKGWT
jgi:hypothetical protein